MLTEADHRILKVIQAEGRITNQELAHRCGLSPSACFDRLKRLREQEYILGFHALLDPNKLDRSLLIFIEVLMDRTTGDVFKEFAASVSAMPEILECHMVAGGFDYLIKVRVRDMAAYRTFLADTLVHMPGIRETRTYAVLDEVKNVTSLPL